MASKAAVPDEPVEDAVEALIRKLRLRDSLDAREAQVLRDSVERVEQAPVGRVLVRAGQPLTHSILIVDGVVARYKDLSDGQRQITEVHVAGDFVDLHGFLLKHLDHNISALTAVRLAYVPHIELKRITEREPHLGRMLWLSTLIDAAVQRERILSIGRRSAVGRIAHLLCELHVRLEAIAHVKDRSFRLPITQIDIADATGLTAVHVNRMLRELRSDGIVTFRGGTVDIHDLPRLQQVAEFTADYLFLEREPR